MDRKPKIGDRISILFPGNWQRFGVVVETDYHPFGIDDAARIQFEDEIAKSPEWWDIRWLQVVAATVEKVITQGEETNG